MHVLLEAQATLRQCQTAQPVQRAAVDGMQAPAIVGDDGKVEALAAVRVLLEAQAALGAAEVALAGAGAGAAAEGATAKSMVHLSCVSSTTGMTSFRSEWLGATEVALAGAGAALSRGRW